MQPFGEHQSCNEGKIKAWGADHCQLAAPKDAVKFHDPINCRPEKIPVTKEMRKSARFAHSAYKARLDAEKDEKKMEIEETKTKKEEDERLKKERGGYFKQREESKRRFRSCR